MSINGLTSVEFNILAEACSAVMDDFAEPIPDAEIGYRGVMALIEAEPPATRWAALRRLSMDGFLEWDSACRARPTRLGLSFFFIELPARGES